MIHYTKSHRILLLAGCTLLWFGCQRKVADAAGSNAPSAKPDASATKAGLGNVVSAADTTTSAKTVVGVEELMKHRSRYKGPVTVKGVVSQVLPSEHLVQLIDQKEFEECNSASCSGLSLPVRWSGAMPSRKQLVLVNGTIGSEGGESVFMAESITIPKPAAK